ncbi:hypothetical protein LV716_08340 [Flagellimonas sp. HMM57]|uniref:response regulator transcription factor n=1 Tax=unclassified Flagellimonas TaxID=2644544 RepID=UPI0013D7EF78|nr:MULTISPECIES: response regulator transcription factor [unclassified Flagellimonas]UII77763.1 hypothetical protein LV716_08340 [Flagellimonas sp. HMM57]
MNQILIVEDEPTLSDAYSRILGELFHNNRIDPFDIHICNSLVIAHNTIDVFLKSGKNPTLCILDYRLEKMSDEDNENGMGIGMILRKHFPDCKIMLITSIADKYLYQTIIDQIKPSGFLIKSEINYRSIGDDICSVLEGKLVYSKTINDFIKNSPYSKYGLDYTDLKLIHLMSKRYTFSEIALKMGISISGVEYRKRSIAKKLGAVSSTTKDLLKLFKQELDFS